MSPGWTPTPPTTCSTCARPSSPWPPPRRRCAARPDHLERFYEILSEGDRAFRERRYDDVRRLKAEFSEHLAVASQNVTLIALMRIVRHKIEWAASTEAMKQVAEQARERRLEIQREVVEAIASRDPDRAATAASANIDAAYASLGWTRLIDVRGRALKESK